MKTFKSAILGIVVLAALAAVAQTSSNVSVFATGFNNPRGLKFGPDGNLYVAEGGAGGTLSSVGVCKQVVAPIGPYTGGFTARISKVTPDGIVTTVADNLPSDQTSAAQGSLVSGVADVAFVGNTLYAILAGAGCSQNPQQIGKFVPLAAAGTFSFDGHGTTSRSFTLSYGGAIFPVSDSGPYTVNSDWTVSATYSDGTWKMVIIGHGKEIKAINASPGAVVQGILTRQERAD